MESNVINDSAIFAQLDKKQLKDLASAFDKVYNVVRQLHKQQRKHEDLATTYEIIAVLSCDVFDTLIKKL